MTMRCLYAILFALILSVESLAGDSEHKLRVFICLGLDCRGSVHVNMNAAERSFFKHEVDFAKHFVRLMGWDDAASMNESDMQLRLIPTGGTFVDDPNGRVTMDCMMTDTSVECTDSVGGSVGISIVDSRVTMSASPGGIPGNVVGPGLLIFLADNKPRVILPRGFWNSWNVPYTRRTLSDGQPWTWAQKTCEAFNGIKCKKQVKSLWNESR